MNLKIVICLVLAMMLTPGQALCAQSDENIIYEAGKTIHQYNQSSNSLMENQETILYQGKHIVITEPELRKITDVYTIGNHEDPEQEALDYLIERKAIYYTATENGITASEDEIDHYCDQIKQGTDSGNSEVQAMYAAFGGEENYWKEMRDVYEISCVIHKYWDREKEKYLSTIKESDDLKRYELWQREREEKTREIVASEEVKKAE